MKNRYTLQFDAFRQHVCHYNKHQHRSIVPTDLQSVVSIEATINCRNAADDKIERSDGTNL